RYGHTASVLTNGNVLVVGGLDADGFLVNSIELYNPSTGTWPSIVSVSNAGSYQTATVLSNGKVLVTGGYSSVTTSSCELY
ncbi:unnamed protein product, partial [Rotaria socialis]